MLGYEGAYVIHYAKNSYLALAIWIVYWKYKGWKSLNVTIIDYLNNSTPTHR